MKDVKVHAKDILRMIPDEELAKLSSSTKVDYCAKVLSGERMFYLLVFALLAADQISQRKLEVVFNNSRADGYVPTRLMYRLICTSC